MKRKGKVLKAFLSACIVWFAIPFLMNLPAHAVTYTQLDLTRDSVDENQPVGTVIGSFEPIGLTAQGEVRYEFASGEGSEGNNSFTITTGDSVVLKTNAVFDYETKSSYSIRVRVSDESEEFQEKIFAITVNNVSEGDINSAPVAANQSLPVNRNSSAHNSVSAVDADGDELTYERVSGPGHGTLNFSSDGSYIYTPDPDYLGPDSFTFRAYDGDLYSSTATVAITVGSVNNAPTITGNATGSTAEGTPFLYSFTIDDAEDDEDSLTVTYSSSNILLLPEANIVPGGSGANRTLTMTPAAGRHGTVDITITVRDSGGLLATKTVTLTVSNINDAPVIAEGANKGVTMSEDGAPTGFNLTLNASDADGDTLTWSISTPAEHGTASASGTGASKVITYTPHANYHGSDSFVVTVADGNGGVASITITVTIEAVNDAPVNTVAPSVSGIVHNGNTLTAAPGSWNDDADGETEALTFSYQWQTTDHVTGGAIHNLTDETGTTYRLASAETGTYIRIKVICSDGSATSEMVSQWYQVVNANPVIEQGSTASLAFVEDGPAQSLAFTATDLDEDTLTWSITEDPVRGALELVGSTVTYKPAANANGSDRFVVTVTDGHGGSASITVNVTIEAVNDVPVIAEGLNKNVTMSEDGTPVGFNLTLNASDADGDTLTWSISEGAGHGTASASGTGSPKAITYTPNANYNGTDSFVVTVTDGNEGSASITINVTIEAVNDVPVIAEGSNKNVTMSEDGTPTGFNLTLNATDADSDTLTWSIGEGAEHGTASVSGTGASKVITYTPNANYHGSDSFVVTVADGNGGVASITINVTIEAVNDAPVIAEGSNKNVTMSEDGTPTGFSLTLNATDADGDTLTWSIGTPAEHGTASVSGTGASKVITYTPNANYNGTDSFVVTVTDGHGGSASITVNVTIEAVNDAPVIAEGSNKSVTMSEDGAPTGFNLTLNATDADSDTLTWSIGEGAEHGTASVSGTGASKVIAYTPNANYHGSDRFVVTVADGNGGTASITVNVTIEAVNDAPTITGDALVSTDEDVPFVYSFTIDDVEDDENGMTVSFETSDTALLPKANIIPGGTGANRTLTLTPALNRYGTVNITLTLRDSAGATVTETVTLTVNSVNDAPVISVIANRVMEEDRSSGPIGFAISDVDSDVNGITVTATSNNEAVIKNDSTGIALGGSGANHTITLTPVADQSGSAVITITVNDNSGTPTAIAVRTFEVTVTAVNDPPAIENIADVIIDEDRTTGDIPFAISDPDDTDLTVTASTDNTSMIPRDNIVLGGSGNTRTIRVTPVANKYGTARITVMVKDSSGLMATDTFTLTVNSVNDLPTLSEIPAQTTDEDTVRIIDVTAGDIETAVGDLTLHAVSSSNEALVPLANITFGGSGANRTVRIVPAADMSDSSTIKIEVRDGDGGASSRQFVLTVNPVNDAPVFTAGADVMVAEDCKAQTVSGWATGISAGPSDESEQSLTFTVTNDNNALFAVQPELDTAGTLTFTPADNANGYANITVRLTDGPGAYVSKSFKITVTAVNDAPVAQDMEIELDTDEDQSYKGYLLATDVERDPLTYSIVEGTSHGTITITNPGTGAFQYTPNPNYFGTDSVTFKVNDGQLDSNTATVTIQIIGINDAPEAADLSLAVDEDEAVEFAYSATDIDTDMEYITYTPPISGPTHGTVSYNPDTEKYVYTPAPDYYGPDRFTYRAYDGNMYSNLATVTITVNPVNDAPVAQGESILLDENQVLHGVLKASDIERDALRYDIITPVDPEILSLNSNTGAYTFTPAENFYGSVSFQFQAEDAYGARSELKMVTITVRQINQAPEIINTPPVELDTEEDTILTSNISASDPDGDPLTYSIVSNPSHGTAEITNHTNGAFQYTPNGDFHGTDRFTVQATDSEFFTSIILVKITVTGVNDPPVAYNQVFEVIEGNALIANLLGYDPDGDSLAYTYVPASYTGSGSLTVNPDGTFTLTGASAGTWSFQFTVSDGEAVSAPATVTVHVYGSGGTESGISGYGDKIIPEDTSTELTITVTGLSSPSLSVTSSNQSLLDATGINIVPLGGGEFKLTLTPKEHRTGKTVITLEALEGGVTRYVRTFVLTVFKVEHAPVANNKEYTIDEGRYLYEFVTGSDPNGDPLTFSQASAPSSGSLTFFADGTFKYVPDPNFSGDDSFTFSVSDGSTSVTGTATIHVRAVLRPPVANDGTFPTNEDTVYTGTLAGSGSGTLTYKLVTDGSLGHVEITNPATGAFNYTPGANRYGADSFTFKVVGPGPKYLESGVARMNVTIHPVNDAPVPVTTALSTYEDQVLSGYLEATDVERDTLTYSIVAGQEPKKGTLTVDSGGAFTYTPRENETGGDTFQYRVSDGTDSKVQEVIITITPVNDAPVASDDAIGVNEDASVSGSLSEFYLDVDEEGSPTFQLVQNGSKGTVVFGAGGSYTYTPRANANGTDYFSFKVTDSGGLNSNVAQITVTIRPINDAPIMTAAEVWEIDEDSTGNIFNFTVSDVEDAASTLLVGGVSGNTELIPNSGIEFGGSAGDRWMRVTPVEGRIDIATNVTITITVTDSGHDGTLDPIDPKSATQPVTVTLKPVNDVPTINGKKTNNQPISDPVTTYEDTSTGDVPFTIDDEESGGNLTLSGTSSNPALVAASGITFGGIGNNRTVTVTPLPDQFGNTRITITARDPGGAQRTAYLDVIVLEVNDAPAVTPPPAQTINEDTGTETLYYTISDIDNHVETIIMRAASSDETIVRPENIILSGNGAERTVRIIPEPNANGEVTITLIADDQQAEHNTGSATFVVHVLPVNDAPTIEAIGPQVIDEDTETEELGFAVNDIDSPLEDLTISAVSGNTALIDAGGFTYGGSGGNQWIKLKPLANANGSALITVTVSDRAKSSSTNFLFTVNPVNDRPTISAIPKQVILEDKSTNVITYTIGDIDNAITDLQVAVSSVDESVIPLSGIVMTGNGEERTIKITPAPDQNGTVKITLTVSDGSLSDKSEFDVEITPVNDEPSFTKGADITVDEDCGPQTIVNWATNLNKGAPNESGQTLTFEVTGNTNPVLFSTPPAINGITGDLTFAPAADANGTATITVVLQDDGGTANGGDDTYAVQTFVITVNPVNDKPSFTKGADVTVDEDCGPQIIANWATNLNKGAANESGQALTFTVTGNTNPALFSAPPFINPSTGTLTFTPAADANGTATVTVVLKDNGGMPGEDSSGPQSFTITVNAVNDKPSFTKGADITVAEDCGPQIIANWATNLNKGAANESGQALTFTVTGNTNPALFSAPPVINPATGTLTFTPAADANGTATVTVVLKDNGGMPGEDSSGPQSFTITVNAVNDKPSFTKGADITVAEDCGPQTIANWATNLNKGAANESGQTLTFEVTGNTNPVLFSVPPTINPATGTLTFTPAADANGMATVTVVLKDNGGMPGEDSSGPQSFTITVNAVNDKPSFTKGADITVAEDCGPQIIANWATNLNKGAANESGQALTFTVTGNTNPALFSAPPVINPATGTLTFTPAADANGTATVTVVLKDNGGMPGEDSSGPQSFTITVNAVNDKPSFTKGADITVAEDCGPQTIANWATNLNKGAANESGQTLTFTVTGNTNPALFSAPPVINPATGTLTFTPAADANGMATVTVVLKDNGGMPGEDSSDPQSFTITVNAVNDKPSFTKGADITVAEDCGPQTIANWATNLNKGAANESGQTLTFGVTGNTNPVLFSVPPVINPATGTLTFTPAADANGTATVTVVLKDNGGMPGEDSSDPQSFTITVNAVNDKPSFTKGADITVAEDCGPQTIANWATNLNKGAANESGQTLTFEVTGNTNPTLFSTPPVINPATGTLTFTPAANANGTATVTVVLKDSGGMPGEDSSDPQSFTITVNAVNDKPSFTKGADVTVAEDCGPQTIVNWARDLQTGGGTDESGQTLTLTVTNNNPGLFQAAPGIDQATGKLTFTPAANASGTATITVVLQDNGGTANGGQDTYTTSFTITVTGVNDAPSFTKGGDKTVGAGTGAKSYAGWAANLSAGPSDESGQVLTFVVTDNTNPGLFSTPPAITADGTLTFTPASGVSGTAIVTIVLTDDGGTANHGTNTSEAQTFQITVRGNNELGLQGTVRDVLNNSEISGASVRLYDLEGNPLAATVSGPDGAYAFTNLTAGSYLLEVSKIGYNDNLRKTEVSFAVSETGLVTEDFLMAKFLLTLAANPQYILGDGIDSTVLTATVLDTLGNPLSGVTLHFYAEKGSFSGGNTALTSPDGKATINFVSDVLSGPDQIILPVVVSVSDPVRKLYGSARIFEYFVPGFVEGIVKDGSNANTPIEGAIVRVYLDEIGFSETQVTGADGKYKIAVPKGNRQYHISITKPVTIGTATENVTVTQQVSVGDLTDIGSETTYAPAKTATGIVVLQKSDSATLLKNLPDHGMTLEFQDASGTVLPYTMDPDTGVFSADNLSAGTYNLLVIHNFGDGRSIILGRSEIIITENGEMNISQVLIDPYGIITDAATGAVLNNVDVRLYYADTARNTANGITPNTLVPLPPVSGFPPADNANPQFSDAMGNYAYMVFPHSDYYIVAAKAGYETFTSGTISVETAIVKYDFQMRTAAGSPGGGGGGGGGGGPIVPPVGMPNGQDLAVAIFTDTMKVEEGSSVNMTIRYRNKSNSLAEPCTVTVIIPDGLRVVQAKGGTVSGNQIVWSNLNLDALFNGAFGFVLAAGEIPEEERLVEVIVRITCENPLINLEDDESRIKILLYSNRHAGVHKRYIAGYPDGSFGIRRNITRAETAAIFARLLDLDVSAKRTDYQDVPRNFWATGYISAVSDAGLMKGYGNGSFRPNDAITRAEFASIIARYFKIDRTNLVLPLEKHFSDIDQSWAMSSIEEIYRYNIVKGYEDGTFRPEGKILRTEAVTMINHMLYRGPLVTTKIMFSDVQPGAWYFGHVSEASESHRYTINEDGTETVTEWIQDEIL